MNYLTIYGKVLSLTLVIVIRSPSIIPCGIGEFIIVGLIDGLATQTTGGL